MSQELTVAELQSASEAFYQALADVLGGNAKSMLELWSSIDDVTYLGPMGELVVGASAVSAAWQAQANVELGGVVTPDGFHYVVGGPIGIVTNWENGTGHKGVDHDIRIRVTSTYRREGDAIRMIGHHTDLIT